MERRSQADLARHLGIDQSTVSRAFTDPDMVTSDLRSRINDAAMQLGYRANRMARATRLGRTEHLLIIQGIGVSVSTLHAEILAGLHDALEGTELHLGLLRLEDRVIMDETPRSISKHLSGQARISVNSLFRPSVSHVHSKTFSRVNGQFASVTTVQVRSLSTDHSRDTAW